MKKNKKMKNETESTLIILECFLKYEPFLSPKDLKVKINLSEKKIRSTLSVLEKRGYLVKVKGTDSYRLSRKITMLI